MPVRVVTDSAACLPDAVVDDLDITVIDLHMMRSGKDSSTSGLSALELVAIYARQLERGGDEGVLALHLSKELSSTWSNAVTAAAVFDDDLVRVVDTSSMGMGVGAAVMAAAKLAQDGADLEICYDAAVDVLDRSDMWLYVHRMDELRRSGRLSTTTQLISTVPTGLANRPILHLKDGRLEILAKTRTQSKGLAKLVELACHDTGDTPVFAAVQQHEAREAARALAQMLTERLPEGSTLMIVDMDPVLAVHSGPGAVAVSMVYSADAAELTGGLSTGD
ncbi:DegV family protein [Corynebacterium sp. CCM 8835]|uniref:DegV family protein n=1 Tax=Corynebacterium antarcticum TaxID=2800405 RepID=A0ABS1FNG9_9CORY|nr:DegV family protein [Corynebacterium antarcticum]MCK7642011.1 DegV family protein [Corynebacterium antarcticum]MCK7659889.1 DegV family protein [Corynebacterium antarcticum]MCL0245236.1 DegV family protein [Corynebacterium antarcticum]MCX7492927.1 DegV family protein [Corynebacterium antarcticum]